MFEIINPSMVSLIQSILIILSGLVILIASIGILTFDKNMPNVVYVRIHVLGMIDVAGIVVFLALGQYLFAVLYLVLAPFLAHAMANAYFYGEDDYNTLYAADMVEDKYAVLNAPDKLDDDVKDAVEDAAADVSGEDAMDAVEDAADVSGEDSAEGNADETASENLDSGDESND